MAEWQRQARRAGLSAAYPRVEGLHLTLVFLGEVAGERLAELGEVAAAVASATQSFPLLTANVGAFPPHGSPKVIWLGLNPSTSLARLQNALAMALEPLGFPREDRPFTPHLTLARPKGKGIPALPEVPPALGWTASAFALYESVPELGGQRYAVKESWTLSGSPHLR